MNCNRLREHFAIHSRYFPFARGIDLHQPQPIRVVKRGGKLLQQMLRPRKAMGLEDDEQPAGPQSFEGLQRSSNLGWMMAVIVKNTKAIIREKFLLPPGRAVKSFDSASNVRRRKAELMQERDGSRGVGHILFAEQLS